MSGYFNSHADFTTNIVSLIPDMVQIYRKGPETESADGATQVWGYPPIPEVPPDGWELVDCHFVVIGVDLAKATERQTVLARVLSTYPEPARFERGLSFLELGPTTGGQEGALCLMAVGKVLGWWEIITPERLHIDDPTLAATLAGNGLVMISGHHPKKL